MLGFWIRALTTFTSWFTIGIAVGVSGGIMTDNLGLWLSLGVVFGLLGPTLFPKKEKKDE